MIGVVGASGFIGRNLVEHLQGLGRAFVPLARRPVPNLESETVFFDLDNPEEAIRKVEGLSAVVLLASASVPSTFANDLGAEIERNVRPYAVFLERLARAESVRKVVFLSSGGTVYGRPLSSRIGEDHPRLPIANYGCGKLLIEDLVASLSQRAGWTYAILRPSNPVGRYQYSEKGQGLVATTIANTLRGRPVEVWGDGSSRRDYFSVHDLSRAIVRVLDDDAPTNITFNVGLGRTFSIAEVIDLCEAAMGRPVERRHIEQKSFLVKDVALDVSRIQAELGWQCEHGLPEAIGEAEQQLRAQLAAG